MTEKRFIPIFDGFDKRVVGAKDNGRIISFMNMFDLLNELHEENQTLKKELKDCEKLKTKRLNKIRNHRAVIEDLGGSIRAYKGKLSQANEKIDKIKETMEYTGALTKGQLERILDD